jgi:diguanylate cyclase (GGDEF)-like protein
VTNLPAVYVANGAAILFLLTILLSFKKPVRHGLLDERIYNLMVYINILQCLVESATFFMDGKIEYYTLSILLNVILFINSVILSFSWVIYADYKLFSDVKRIKRIYPWLAIPAVLTIIGCLLNTVTPVFFSIDQYNVYHRTSLFIIPYGVTYFYFAYGVILINVNRKKVHKRMFLPATLFMVPVAIGSVLQIFFYGYSFIWLGVSIGMMSLFINVQNEASYVDVLSGLYNRQYLNNLLLMYSERKDTDAVPVGIMLDIDNFKSINDQFGHAVGDEAIFTAGKILHAAVHDKGKAFRYGGDEFIILMLVKNSLNTLKEIMDMIDLIKTESTLFNESNKKPYKINFSFGYSTFHSKHDSIDDFLNRIDASMYEDKKKKFSEGFIIDKRNQILMAKGNE